MELQQRRFIQYSNHIDMEILASSGQAFRIKKISPTQYVVPTGNTVFIIEQEKEGLYYDVFTAGYPVSAEQYFRTTIQLPELLHEVQSDPYIRHAYSLYGVLPLLQQDYFETIISFIISANKHFAHICQCIDTLCSTFGEPINTPFGTFFLFPTVKRLANATIDELHSCKVGYRAPYIQQSATYITEHKDFISRIANLKDESAIAELKKLPGVGDKVADCILLFGYGRDTVVPYDVWLHRIMQDLYDFPPNTPYHIYRQFNEKHFGVYAGWVQQLLFYHARKVHKRGTSFKETWFDGKSTKQKSPSFR